MKCILSLVLFAFIFVIPAKAQDPTPTLTLAVANKQLSDEKANLQSQVASLEIRLEMAQARIAELEKSAKPQSIVVTVQPDPSAAQVNREAAANLRAQRALAIAGAFRTQPVQVQMPVNPVRTCTSMIVGNQLQTVCQ